MTGFTTIDKLIPINVAQIKSSKLVAEVAVTIAGIVYGVANYINNQIQAPLNFESSWLATVFVPLLFIVGGVAMAFITRLGIVGVYWAMARMLGGPGRVGRLYHTTGTGFLFFWPWGLLLLTGTLLPIVAYLLVAAVVVCSALGIGYLTRELGQTQQFSTFRSIIAIILTVVFMVSVYYLILPQG
ncbi:hypothetical protein MFMK1_002101 [Metallumcola ferriviriculae]|uniref:Yip1 domain-containing protein n=1 Tax=Metallumcola ferriviriculae TaxID=3039180 RepID=A0AAU0UPX0_9FIRM|nr:hypothetical protein MFMK1_002101 [Desulfitibacteraceae bacterium MK1]